MNNCTCGKKVVPITIPKRHEDPAYYHCPKCMNSYSVIANTPLEYDELCRGGKIYQVRTPDPGMFEIIGAREDVKKV